MKTQKKLLLSCCVIISAAAIGCNNNAQILMNDIPRSEYEKNFYETATVEKGDCEPDFVLNIKTVEREKVAYSFDEGEYDVKKVYVEIGDHVEKGQLLLELDSKELNEQHKTCISNVRKEELLLEYYTKLDAEDTSGKNIYKSDVIKHTNALALARISLSEISEKISKCSFTAQEEGDIVMINNSVISGHVTSGNDLMCEAFGDESYYAETEESYEFNIGDEYVANSAFGDIKMTVTQVTEEGSKTRIDLVPSDKNAVVNGSDSLTVTIHKSKLNGAVFVSGKAIHELEDGRHFVYVVNEDGFCKVVFVEIGDSIGEKAIIKSGLNGGEEVAVR